MSDTDRAWAIKRIRAKRAFWIHFGIYVAVNVFLVGVWAVTWRGYFWPVWPMLGWGIGVAAHALTVFTGGMDISEARIQREIDRRG
jgi:2TM domain